MIRHKRYLDLSRLGAPECILCVAGPVLFAAMFLPLAGRPGAPDSLIHLGAGYPLGLLATVAITYAGWRRQATLTPPNAHRVTRIWSER
jgi:hypothetical protein